MPRNRLPVNSMLVAVGPVNLVRTARSGGGL
jgi:hypothetical protein